MSALTTPDVAEYHAELAEKFVVRLPRRDSAKTTANMNKILRQLGLTWAGLEEWTGQRREGQKDASGRGIRVQHSYFRMNPERDLRDWAGELLEALEYAGFERDIAAAGLLSIGNLSTVRGAQLPGLPVSEGRKPRPLV